MSEAEKEALLSQPLRAQVSSKKFKKEEGVRKTAEKKEEKREEKREDQKKSAPPVIKSLAQIMAEKKTEKKAATTTATKEDEGDAELRAMGLDPDELEEGDEVDIVV